MEVLLLGIQTLYVKRNDDPHGLTLLKQLKKEGYTELSDIIMERVFRLEGDFDIEGLIPLLVNPVFETYSNSSYLKQSKGPIFEVGYQKAVTDPETPSILEAAKILNIKGLKWVRLSTRYQFVALDEETAQTIVEDRLYNPVVQMLISPDTKWDSLRPTGIPEPIRHISLKGLREDELRRVSEENSWYAPIEQLKVLQEYETELDRPLTDAEIEIIVQSWSDHCYHTTWKGLDLLKMLKDATLKINHPLIVSIFSDNAGGIDFFDDWVVTIKGETHNFPSAIATFGGVATKHGGVIRDTIGFGKGGYPIGGSTIMGTMDPRISKNNVPPGALHPGHIVRESVRATAYYCNPMGIPMMYPIYKAHENYPKCLALGHSIGIVPKEYALKDSPCPGDAVLLFGGRTGRDGIHGATASSAGMTGQTANKESAAVQIGHPITERKFMEAVPVMRDAGCIRSITDLGAGGISCAAGEMGEDTGVELNLESVPLKDQSLTAWEILLSESQERMLAAVPPEKLGETKKILEKYDVEYSVIGMFTDDRKYKAHWRGEKAVDMSMNLLWGACPIKPLPVKEETKRLKGPCITEPSSADEFIDICKRIVGHYNCCDQTPAGFQFDWTVQGRTVIGPYGGVTGKMPTGVYACRPLRDKPYGLISTVAYNPFYGDVDPRCLARLMIIEAVSKAIAAGANAKAIALCDNFYTPRSRPEVAWNLKKMVETAAETSIMLGMPFISGKDSSSGTFETSDNRSIEVPYTFVVSTICPVKDGSKVITKDFKEEGNNVVFVGNLDKGKLGGSVYLDLFNERRGELAGTGEKSIPALLNLWNRLYNIYNANNNPIKSACAIGEGGMFMKLFEMCYGGGKGVQLDLNAYEHHRLDEILFSESIGAMLFEIDANVDPQDLFGGYPCAIVGHVKEESVLSISHGNKSIDIDMKDLIQSWEAPFKEVM